MRVNHVGEVCAQALYDSQARYAQSPAMRMQFEQAGREEEDHLAWTAQRLSELGSQPSVLNPLWYAGAYAMGTVAAKLGDANSLGFVVETGCSYFSSISFPDLIHVGVRVAKLGNSSVRYEIALYRNDDPVPAAAGHFVHVYVDRRSNKSVPIPDAVRAILQTLLPA